MEPTSNSPERLILEKMTLHNFKSYKGTLQIGPFHEHFSSIVGPNGSGKSNIIDALLFVFGRRSTEIRFKRIAELIYRGGDNVPADRCSVEVHFASLRDSGEEAERPFGINPASRFSISREVTPKGVSKYKVSGKTVSFREVAELLLTKGIDLHNNRFLILQGEVESIAQMKPVASSEGDKGLLEYLEEIIGTGRFVPKISEALSRLDALTEQRQESFSRVKLVEREKQSLEGSKQEAMDYLKKEWKYLERNIVLQQIHIFYLRKGLDCIAANESRLKEQETEERLKLENSQQQQEEIRLELEKEKHVFEKIDAKCRELLKKFNALEEEDAPINVNIDFEKKRYSRAKKKLRIERSRLEGCETKINLSRVEIPKIERQILELQKTLNEKKSDIDKLCAKFTKNSVGLREELESKQKELIPFQKKFNSAKQKVEVCKGKIESMEEGQESIEEQLNDLRKEIENSDLKTVQTKKEIEVAQVKVTELENSLNSAESSLKKITAAKTTSLPMAQKLRYAAENARRTRDKQRSSAGLLSEIEALKSSGEIAGIEGRLGSLGRIAAKFDVAVSTASGLLNCVLVDRAETGAKCIEHLKARKLGRASFMLLDKQRHLHEACARTISTPENVPRLFDLVEATADRYRPAFYCALRDTLFAEDIDQAVRVSAARGRRWRVVTARGELLDQSGTMSGGGRSARRGALMLKSASAETNAMEKAELDEICRKSAEADERLRKLSGAERNLSRRLELLGEDLREQTIAANKLSIDEANEAEVAKSLRRKAQSLQARLGEAQNAQGRKALKAELVGAEARLEKEERRMAAASAVCERLEEKLFAAGGSEVKAAKAEAEAVAATLAEANTKLNEMRLSISMGENKMQATISQVAAHQKALSAAREKIQALKDASRAIEEKAKALFESHKAEVKLRDAERERLADRRKRLEESEEESKALRLALVDVEDQLRDFAANIAANRAKVEARERRRDALLAKIRRSEEVLLAEAAQKALSAPEPLMSGETPKCPESDVGSGCVVERLELFAGGELPPGNKADVEGEVERLAAEMKACEPNLSVIEEYRSKLSEYNQRVESLSDATRRAEEAKKDYDEFRKARHTEFMSGFSVITRKLKEVYQNLTLGGDAELECVDRFDPFSEGIEFSVRPPKKSWKNISNLSGGEKTLSSLSLVFALHHFRPTPLYVMDEIDAALDFKNVSIVAEHIRQHRGDAQFIVVSLRHSMFEAADRLVGVYKTHNFSKSLVVNPQAALQCAKAD